MTWGEVFVLGVVVLGLCVVALLPVLVDVKKGRLP